MVDRKGKLSTSKCLREIRFHLISVRITNHAGGAASLNGSANQHEAPTSRVYIHILYTSNSNATDPAESHLSLSSHNLKATTAIW